MRRVLMALGVVLALTTALMPGEARGNTDSEAEIVNAMNRERAARGLPAFTVHRDLVDDARAHAGRMAGAGRIYHNGNLTGVTGGWSSLAENVGMGGSPSAVHSAFMASSSHRVNILGNYSYVGVGTAWAWGRLYVDVVFMQGGWTASPYQAPFWDDEITAHERDIGIMSATGLTAGCSPGQFCEWRPVTRGEMAAFLVKGLGLRHTSRDYFWDDNGHLFEAQINALTAAGITDGCGGGKYCPQASITRGQMAVFLVNGLKLGGSSSNPFWDDNGHPFEWHINALAGAGITSGCASGRFCPDGAVTRGQMATFLVTGLRLR